MEHDGEHDGVSAVIACIVNRRCRRSTTRSSPVRRSDVPSFALAVLIICTNTRVSSPFRFQHHHSLGDASRRRVRPRSSVAVTGPRKGVSGTVLFGSTSPDVAPVPSGDGTKDTIQRFAADVQHVLHNLRGSELDPDIPAHRILKRIFPQQCALLAWCLVSVWLKDHYFKPRPLPLSSLGTVSTFVAFLLTLRSNQALERLKLGRELWSRVILDTREMASLVMAFVYPVDKQLALMLARHVALFGWLLKSQLRFVRRDDVVELVRAMLPNKKDADYVLSQRIKTVAVITRIRQVLAHLGKQHKLTTAEEIAIDHSAHALSSLITSTGRLRATPIPTLYTSHTSRLLLFYLFSLPPALHASGLSVFMTTLLSLVVGFAMFGLDEISHLFEQPFRVIPMYAISRRSMLAVADAFACQPPELEGEVSKDEEKHLSQKDLTLYWSKEDISSVSDNLME
ncbi:hypothetical protein THAOC_33029 [Thalassiosira oceanica]|uniref:Bestrophin homolog n=1 Tax=Thalassiosira oceanica TaxID=159749 RepID=K0R622_THAOC|nr:hypothetical protein THAOC_33029 [Thalassiosira oceanica]|eukprot:EJK48195.1 hypothetical protein THAOC_33029 [Thalassiosira oceanica]